MQIRDIIDLLIRNSAQYGIKLFKGATENEIEGFELKMKIQLPDALKTFYRFCNGFESAEDLFRIIPLDEILDRLGTYKPNTFYLAEYLTYCDIWEISINPDDKNDYLIFNNPDKFRPLTKSVSEFLERFLAKGVFGDGGLYDWHEEIDAGRN